MSEIKIAATITFNVQPTWTLQVGVVEMMLLMSALEGALTPRTAEPANLLRVRLLDQLNSDARDDIKKMVRWATEST